MNNIQHVLQQAVQTLQQAQQNPANYEEQLRQCQEQIKLCMNEPAGQEHQKMLEDICSSVENAIHASKQPSNSESVSQSFEEAIRACDQAADSTFSN